MKRNSKILLFLILFVATFLRLYKLDFNSLYNDELSIICSVKNLTNFNDYLNNALRADGHTAGYSFFLYFYIKLFGYNSFILRLSSALAGVFSVFIVYLIGKKWNNEKTGLIAAALLCVLELHLLNSRIVRPYSFGICFYLLFVLYWSNFILKKSINFKELFILVFSGTIAISMHYFSALTTFFTIAIGLFFIDKNSIKKYSILIVSIGILSIPNLFLLFKQISSESTSIEQATSTWIPMPNPFYFFEYLFHIFNESWFIISTILILLIFNIFKTKFKIPSIFFIGLVLFIFPYIFGHLYSIFARPILQFRYIYFSFPFLLLFISYVLSNKKYSTSILIIILIGIFSLLFENNFYHKNHYGIFKELVNHIEKNETDLSPDNITHIANINNPEYFQFYSEKHNYQLDFSKYYTKSDLKIIHHEIAKNNPCLDFSWSTRGIAPEVFDMMNYYYPTILEDYRYTNSAYTLFSKGVQSRKPLWKNENNYSNPSSNYWKTKENQVYRNLDTTYERLSSTDEYSSKFEIPINAFNLSNYDSLYITAKVDFKSLGELKSTLVIQINRNDEKIDWYGNNLEDFQLTNNSWNPGFVSHKFPIDLQPNDLISIYIWKRNYSELFLDNFEIQIFPKKSNSIIFY